jgi:hypothetical protein
VAFDVHEFSEDAFLGALANNHVDVAYMRANRDWFPQAFYLVGYLARLAAKRLVVEHEYVDRDYLADYASYYVSCFENYGPRCKRIHFFKNEFDEAQLRAWIERPEEAADATLQDAYLGFVVARPLPEAVVGRTVLQTYDVAPGQREYARRIYKVSLFGIDLHVESLAYQQQDTVVAACATVALWTAFHKTSQVFEHPLLRPAEITSAANRVQGGGRAMPSSGLRAEQVYTAIRRAGLEPVAEQVSSQTLLMSLIYGYLEFGLPVVLLGRVESAGYAGHAITVSGYSLAATSPTNTEPKIGNIDSKGRYIEKLYIHDDNIGPFARTFPTALPGTWPAYVARTGQPSPPFALQATDPANNPQSTFVPEIAVVPVYGKVRITYSEAHTWAARLQDTLAAGGVHVTDLVWSVYLTTTQRYKSDLRARYAASADARAMMTEGQPRFIWRGVAVRPDGSEVIELLVDATGVYRSCPVFRVLWHDAATKAAFDAQIRRVSKQTISDVYTEKFADLVYP